MKITHNTIERMSDRARSKSTRAVTALVISYADGVVAARTIDGAILHAKCSVPVRVNSVVLIGAEPHAPNQLRVLDVRYVGGADNGIQPHGTAHTLGGTDVVPIWFGQVMDWSIEPDGMTLKMWRGAAETSSGYLLPEEITIDLSPHIPETGALYALIYLKNDGTIGVLTGSAKPTVSEITEADIPPRPSNSASLYAVLLYARQARIVRSRFRSDIIDLRLASALSPVGGGGTVSLPANRVIATDNGGLPADNAPFWDENGLMRWTDAGAFDWPTTNLLGLYLAAETLTPGISLLRIGNTVSAGAVNFIKYGGTKTSPAPVQSGWRLGSFSFGGHYGSGVDALKVRIAGWSTEDWNDTNRGAKVKIEATPNGSATMQDVAEFKGDRIDLLQPTHVPAPPVASNDTQAATTSWIRDYAQPLDSDLTAIAGLSGTGVATRVADGVWQLGAGGGREILTANRTYYIRTDGNDNNNGLSNTPEGAFRTATKANQVVASLDKGGYDVTVKLGPGTWNEYVKLKTGIGDGNVTWEGSKTPVVTATAATVTLGGGATRGTVNKTNAFTGLNLTNHLAYFVTDNSWRLIESNTASVLTLNATSPSTTTQDVIVYSLASSIQEMQITNTQGALNSLIITGLGTQPYSLHALSGAYITIENCWIYNRFRAECGFISYNTLYRTTSATISHAAQIVACGAGYFIGCTFEAPFSSHIVIQTIGNTYVLLVAGHINGTVPPSGRCAFGLFVNSGSILQHATVSSSGISGATRITNADTGARAQQGAGLVGWTTATFVNCVTTISADAATYSFSG